MGSPGTTGDYYVGRPSFRYPVTKPVRATDEIQPTKPVPPVRSSATKIKRVGASLRGILDGDHSWIKMVTPMAVAIGPYHHCSSQLEEMQKAKQVALEEFCRQVNQTREAVREKITGPVAASACSCYTNLSDDHCDMDDEDDKDELAEMMLLDGCFLLQFMASMCPDVPKSPTRKKDDLMVEVHTHIDDISRDIMLLENQIPWSVLKVLMELRPELAVAIDRFLDLMASAFDVGNEKGNNSTDLQQGQGRDDHRRQDLLLLVPEPDHLLDLFYRRQVGTARTQELFVPKLSSLSSTAVELAEMGVKLTASKTKDFGDMSVKKRKWLGLFGELSLAPLVLNDLTACWLINMAAYEAGLGATQADNFAVSSYVSVVALLMNREEDVQELRTKGIVHSAYSNEETLTFFKWVGRHMRVGHRYYQVFERLNEYKNERYLWIAVHRFFYKNIKTIAAILSIAGVLAGLFKTILSLKQPHQ